MALAIGAIIALLAIMVAAYPFRRRKAASDSGHGLQPDDGSELLAEHFDGPDQLDTIYEAIRTLHLEREIGNIPDGLYREQMNLYRREAALLLRDYERKNTGNLDRDLDWALEEEVKVARASLNASAGSNRPSPSRSRPASKGATDCSEGNEPNGSSVDAVSDSAGSAQSTPGNGC